jgi:uncharacterized protein YdhG (YjbR/CyaY superfamily)
VASLGVDIVQITDMVTKPKTVDDYLEKLNIDRRQTLEKLRRRIHRVLPNVEECISYSMPAFRFNGHIVAGFLATKNGYSFYPFSGTTLATLAHELTAFKRTKSALHFDEKHPITVALLRQLLKARVAESKEKFR